MQKSTSIAIDAECNAGLAESNDPPMREWLVVDGETTAIECEVTCRALITATDCLDIDLIQPIVKRGLKVERRHRALKVGECLTGSSDEL